MSQPLVQNIFYKKKLYAIYVKNSFSKNLDKTLFITEEKNLFQMGFIYKNKETIPLHYHPKRKRVINGTSEFLILKRGKAQINFYTNKKVFIDSFNLKTNDIVLILNGAHEIICSKNCLFLEIKQGPYNLKHDKKILSNIF